MTTAPTRLDELPYAARCGDRRGVVRRAEGDEESAWTWLLDGAKHPVDDPEDHLLHVPEGAVVTLEFGRFEVDLWRGADGATRYRARAETVTGPARRDIEHALWALAEAGVVPRACCFCRHADVEPSTGWGHLACNVAFPEYDAIARSPDPMRRKYGRTHMNHWVVEWHGCERFEELPHKYGYRGRASGDARDDEAPPRPER